MVEKNGESTPRNLWAGIFWGCPQKVGPTGWMYVLQYSILIGSVLYSTAFLAMGSLSAQKSTSEWERERLQGLLAMPTSASFVEQQHFQWTLNLAFRVRSWVSLCWPDWHGGVFVDVRRRGDAGSTRRNREECRRFFHSRGSSLAGWRHCHSTPGRPAKLHPGSAGEPHIRRAHCASKRQTPSASLGCLVFSWFSGT